MCRGMGRATISRHYAPQETRRYKPPGPLECHVFAYNISFSETVPSSSALSWNIEEGSHILTEDNDGECRVSLAATYLKMWMWLRVLWVLYS